MAKITKEMAQVKAERIAFAINWDGLLERVNTGLIPEKDGEMTRGRFVEMCAKQIYNTGSPVKTSIHGEDTKMHGIISISTSQKVNSFCKILSACVDLICHYCYAKMYISYRSELRVALAYNYILLTQYLLDIEDIPKIYSIFGRIESFGDLEMVKHGGLTQARNYTRIVRQNKRTHWGWWSKHPDIMQKGIDAEGGKPKNLQCVYSSPKVNTPEDFERIHTKCPCIDKIFTVFEKWFIKEHNICVTCGSRDCYGCGKCYLGTGGHYMNEIKK